MHARVSVFSSFIQPYAILVFPVIALYLGQKSFGSHVESDTRYLLIFWHQIQSSVLLDGFIDKFLSVRLLLDHELVIEVSV